jgi:hypothetical protein
MDDLDSSWDILLSSVLPCLPKGEMESNIDLQPYYSGNFQYELRDVRDHRTSDGTNHETNDLRMERV